MRSIFIIWKIKQGRPVDTETPLKAFFSEEKAEQELEELSRKQPDWLYHEIRELELDTEEWQ